MGTHWFPLIRPYYMTRACIGGMTLGTLQQCFLEHTATKSCQSVDYFGTNGVITGIWKALMNDYTPTCPNADFWRSGRNSFIKDTVVAPQDVTFGYGNF